MKDIHLKVEKQTILFNVKMASAKDDSEKSELIREYHENINKIMREENAS